MDERLEQKKSILINAAYYALLLGIYIFFFRYVIYRIMPFFIAVLIALMLSGPATKLAQKLHIPRRGIAAVLVFIFFAAIGSLITFLVIRLIWAVGNWAEQIPEWYEAYIEPFFARVLTWYEGFAVNLNPELAGYFDDLSGEVLGAGMDVANSVASAVIRATRNVVLSVPGTMVGIVFCIIGSFFITMDFPQISHFLMAQLNERGKTIAVKTREYLVNGLGKIVSSYTKIIGITFVELLIGLSIIGISPLANAAKWAIIIAMFDILPVVGVGTVLIPWTIFELLHGSYLMAAELFALYLVIYIVRQIIEPKIVGNTVGISPILMLASIFVGVTLLGPLGLVTLPFTLIVVKNLNDTGYIRLFKSDYLEDEKAYVQAGGEFESMAAELAGAETEDEFTPVTARGNSYSVSLDNSDPEDEDE